MKRMLILKENGVVSEELVGKAIPATNIQRFKLLFMNNDESQRIHKVEVRNINFQDLMRHLKQGESVCITPELLGDPSVHTKKQDRASWYFAHI
jgi:hypothetical protein